MTCTSALTLLYRSVGINAEKMEGLIVEVQSDGPPFSFGQYHRIGRAGLGAISRVCVGRSSLLKLVVQS